MTRMIPALSVIHLTLAAFAFGAEDPTGTWKMTIAYPQIGKSSEVTLKLKLDGTQLTGALINSRGRETQISNGMYNDGKIAFTVSDEIGERKVQRKYSGVVTGDTIKGKCLSIIGGNAIQIDWEAERQK